MEDLSRCTHFTRTVQEQLICCCYLFHEESWCIRIKHGQSKGLNPTQSSSCVFFFVRRQPTPLIAAPVSTPAPVPAPVSSARSSPVVWCLSLRFNLHQASPEHRGDDLRPMEMYRQIQDQALKLLKSLSVSILDFQNLCQSFWCNFSDFLESLREKSF